MKVGQEVEHASYGRGTVVTVNGVGEEQKVTVDFQAGGRHILAVKYANLLPVDASAERPAGPAAEPLRAKNFKEADLGRVLCSCGKPLHHRGKCPGGHQEAKQAKMEEATRLLLEGKTTREVESLVRLGHDTVMQLRADLAGKIPSCACGRKSGHRGRCAVRRGHETPAGQEVLSKVREAPAAVQPTSKRVSMVKTTRQEMTVEEGQSHEMLDLVKDLKGRVEELQKQLGKPVYDFWLEPEQMSRDCDPGESAVLWGAKVPASILDAIWYGLTSQSKANLLSAIAVARYKDRLPNGEPE